jgi:acylphosphatase
MGQCRKCLIAGRVQGVFYRAAAQRKARELGVTGYARNLPDGRVEVLACGKPQAVDALCAWLWQGPPKAEVKDVVCTPVEMGTPADFHID